MSSQAAADPKRPSCVIVTQASMPVCAKPACPNKLSGRAGNSTERLASCSNTTLPQSFTQYLNTSFLGERQFIQVGPVNYTFFQFGPLNSTVLGIYHMLSIADQFHKSLLAYRPSILDLFSFQIYGFALRCHGLQNLPVSCQR